MRPNYRIEWPQLPAANAQILAGFQTALADSPLPKGLAMSIN